MVAPGTYTETATLMMKDYVDVQGSGENVTELRCACSSNDGPATVGPGGAVVYFGSTTDAELSDLSVTNSGGPSEHAYGIKMRLSTAVVSNVTATAANSANNYGIALVSLSDSSLRHVSASATGGTTSTGINIQGNSEPTLTDVIAIATNASDANYAIRNVNASADPTLRRVVATATGTNSYGVHNDTGSDPVITDSVLTGATNSISTLGAGSPALIADTTLDGPAAGNNKCLNVRTAAFAALNATCT